MKRIIFLPVLIMLAAVTAFAAPTLTKKTFEFKGEVETLVLNGCIDIQCVYAPEKAGTIEVTATPTGFEYLDLGFKGNTLKVSHKRNTGIQNLCKEYKKATLYYSHTLNDVQINGSGDIEIPSLDTKRNLTLNINGSGEIDVTDLKAKTLDATVNGSGEIDIVNSTTTDLHCSVNGSGDIEIKNATTTNASTTVSGSGDLDIKRLTSTNVEANLNGSGDLEISGIIASNVTAILNGSGDMELSGKTSSAVYRVASSGTLEAHKLIAKKVEAKATGSGDITYNSGADITKAGRKANIQAQ